MNENIKNTDLIVIIDRKGKILYYNNFNDRINKYNETDTIGKNISEVYTWVNKGTPLFRAMELRQPILNQVFDITIDVDKTITAINSAYPLESSKGVLGAIGFSTSTDKFSTNIKVSPRNNTFGKYVFDDIITVNKEMIELKNKLVKASRSTSNIFIFGASGTGKELFAHSIHNASPRVKNPFIAQNCGAIPSSLVESIFFGTTKGSFTGSEDKKGIFDIADGGTLFLDEINSMPMDLQVKLLRVIEEKNFRRVGGTKDINSDVRLITASNTDMESLLKSDMRKDLFYRLSVVNIEIIPLKERPDDIEVLCDHFISIFNNIFNKSVKEISTKVMDIFLRYSWPGNVRELKNVLECCFNILEGEVLEIEYLPKNLIENATFEIDTGTNLADMVDGYEKSLITKALITNRYSIVNTAKSLGIPRQTLYYKLNKYDLMN